MATTLPTLTPSWTQVCVDGADFFLSLITANGDVDVATTDDGSDPTIDSGHRLSYFNRETGRDSINRAVLGPGYVFAKAVGIASLAVALSTWSTGTWLLAEGVWDDTAVWLDTAVWADS